MKNQKHWNNLLFLCFFCLNLSCSKEQKISNQPRNLAFNTPNLITTDDYFLIEKATFQSYAVPYLFSSEYEFTSQLSYLKLYADPNNSQNLSLELQYAIDLDENLTPDFSISNYILTNFNNNEADFFLDPILNFHDQWELDQPYALYLQSSDHHLISTVAIFKKQEFSKILKEEAGYILSAIYLPKEEMYQLKYERKIPLNQISTQDFYQLKALITDGTTSHLFLDEEIQLDDQGRFLKNGVLFEPKIDLSRFFNPEKLELRTYLLNKNKNILPMINRTIAVSDLKILTIN